MSYIGEQIDALIAREGGYSNDPSDSGGETMYGITVAIARAYGYTGAMKDLPLGSAHDIYLRRYWTEPRFHQVADIDGVIAAKLFDIGVNMGQVWGVHWMQRALNVLNQEAKLWPDLTVDGRIGTLSLYALKTYLQQRGSVGRDVLLAMIRGLQSVRYIELAEVKPSQETYEYGWQQARAML